MDQELLKQVTAKANEWLSPAYDAATQAEVKAMLEKDDKTELVDSFYQDLEFGTGGLRGIMGVGSNRMLAYLKNHEPFSLGVEILRKIKLIHHCGINELFRRSESPRFRLNKA